MAVGRFWLMPRLFAPTLSTSITYCNFSFWGVDGGIFPGSPIWSFQVTAFSHLDETLVRKEFFHSLYRESRVARTYPKLESQTVDSIREGAGSMAVTELGVAQVKVNKSSYSFDGGEPLYWKSDDMSLLTPSEMLFFFFFFFFFFSPAPRESASSRRLRLCVDVMGGRRLYVE